MNSTQQIIKESERLLALASKEDTIANYHVTKHLMEQMKQLEAEYKDEVYEEEKVEQLKILCVKIAKELSTYLCVLDRDSQSRNSCRYRVDSVMILLRKAIMYTIKCSPKPKYVMYTFTCALLEATRLERITDNLVFTVDDELLTRIARLEAFIYSLEVVS